MARIVPDRSATHESPADLRPPVSEHFALADALRAIAILVVVASHVLPDMNFLSSIAPMSVPLGAWGVSAFFVLSGFLLGRPYIDALLGRRAIPDTVLYARRRFLRIWPAYAVIVFVSAALTYVHHGRQSTSWLDIAAHLFMVHNLSDVYVQGVGNGALWTMAVDAQFYVALPLITWLTLTFVRARPDLSRRNVVATLIAVSIVVSFAWRLYAVHAFPVQPLDTKIDVAQRGLVGMGSCFAFGILVALAAALEIRPSKPGAAGICLGGLVLSAMAFSVPFWCPASWTPFAPTIIDVVSTASIACLIFGGFALRSAVLHRLVETSVVSAVAANAYALYLVHMPLKLALYGILERQARPGTLIFSIALLVTFGILTAVAAHALHRFVEAPFLSLKERARETAVATVALRNHPF